MKIQKIFILPVTILLIFSIFIVFRPNQVASGSTQSNWSDSMYLQYNYSSFTTYNPANQMIDFKNIDYELLCAAIFYASNKERVTATSSSPNPGGNPLNLPAFQYSQYLKYSAQMHAYDMVKNNFFSHENPYDKTKTTPFDRMGLCYVTGGIRAENIAIAFGIAYYEGNQFYPPSKSNPAFLDSKTKQPIPNHTYNSFAKELLNGWMHSPSHKKNILNKYLIYLGCGAGFYNDAESYGMPKFKCVQNFGSLVPANKY
ncbi:MAG TPA: CAP domain-containing protein [Candidatus Eremiobacteraeota bacterium]|nr:MAG: Cysteine-rich secretory protein family protein [bacterium ADurb.Bin363]HPZ09687.1 CAP domain-containing protein [Candidatus Eremiobacteraeota bacterium]